MYGWFTEVLADEAIEVVVTPTLPDKCRNP
jgi:hypothetical protein